MKRKCKVCQQNKKLKDFPTAGTKKGISYKRHKCNECFKSDKQKQREKVRLWYVEHKKSLFCADCGNNDYRVLEFHHLNDKKFNVSAGISARRSVEIIKKEIEKCEVLCANCHRIRTFVNKFDLV
jgi:hypothetical protein